jgi:hypothetical protein
MTPAQIIENLQQLGDTAAEVAQNLKDEGCRGALGDPWACPVAGYLEKRSRPQALLFAVKCERVSFYEPREVEEDGTTRHYLGEVPVPLPVGDFIIAFDRGHYPELIR